MSGTFLTAVVYVESWGFHHTLWQAAAGNFTVAFISASLGWGRRVSGVPPASQRVSHDSKTAPSHAAWMTRMILFTTGFIAMAMEVVWTRAFTPVLKTQVYSFAMIVFTYLGATFFGSWVYRRALRNNRIISMGTLLGALALAALLPVLANDPRIVAANLRAFTIDLKSALILLGSLCPFCALLGYLTPRLIDEYAGGQPAAAGRAYAVNVLGCILGPLFACYVLLPQCSERVALILLGLPLLVFSFWFLKARVAWSRWAWGLATGAGLAWIFFGSEDFEEMLLKTQKGTTIRRNYTATVISFGEGWLRFLAVNGVGMTKLTPVTKFMSHLPLAYHKGPPESALVICFGMGTTYRSAMSWGIDTTAVELVPGVTQAFGFYHADAARLVNDPNGHIIIDDGRRYLKRTDKKFDVIIVDPPPPVEAAGSSLLFSKEFYALARQHLKPGGILQMWFPGADLITSQAVLRSIHESFPNVRCLTSMEGWGFHLLATEEPLEPLDAQQLAARMPEAAKKDLVEWATSPDVPAYIQPVISQEIHIAEHLNPDPEIKVTDDRPFNEYFLLRRMW
jgi:spermidine synthase